MDDLYKEYNSLLESQSFNDDDCDYSLLQNHIQQLASSLYLKSSAVSVFDSFLKNHVYESEYHKELFKDEDGVYREVRIHPDDLVPLMKNGIAAFRHLFLHNKHARDIKLIREFRALIGGRYLRVIENMQLLEVDKAGRFWLSLSIADISPNQSDNFSISSKIVNFKTGEVFTPVDKYFDQRRVLSPREVEIIKLIAAGKLSKEISNELNISLHTVNTHRQRILEKMQVDTSIEAIRFATSLGLLD